MGIVSTLRMKILELSKKILMSNKIFVLKNFNLFKNHKKQKIFFQNQLYRLKMYYFYKDTSVYIEFEFYFKFNSSYLALVQIEELPRGTRKVIQVKGRSILLFWYRKATYAIQCNSPAEGAYSMGFYKATFTQISRASKYPSYKIDFTSRKTKNEIGF